MRLGGRGRAGWGVTQQPLLCAAAALSMSVPVHIVDVVDVSSGVCVLCFLVKRFSALAQRDRSETCVRVKVVCSSFLRMIVNFLLSLFRY